MLFWTIVKVGLKSLLANKVRSFLAMLGIVIGVGAMIALVAVGTGARQSVLRQINSLGANLMLIWPQQTGSGGVMSGVSQRLNLGDAQAMLGVSGIVRVSPVASRTYTVKHLSRNTRTRVAGVAPTFMIIRGLEVETGRVFTDAEVENSARVAIIGQTALDNLFEEVTDPLGEIVKINGINFQIIGMLKLKGDSGLSLDDQMVVPFTTAMKQLMGQTSGGQADAIGEINIETEAGVVLEDVRHDLIELVRKRHRLTDDLPDDIRAVSPTDWLAARSQVADTLTYLLGFAAGISLFVGGIGIMNIMLVTVTERTREIGVRKAIGAKERSILFQFLIEAVVVSSVGGLFGIALGVGGARLLGLFPMFAPSVEWWSIVLANVVAGLIGICSGFYPAWRAARLDPVEALRYE